MSSSSHSEHTDSQRKLSNKLLWNISIANIARYKWLLIVLIIMAVGGFLGYKKLIPRITVVKTTFLTSKKRLNAYLEILKSRDLLLSAVKEDPFSIVEYYEGSGLNKAFLYDKTPVLANLVTQQSSLFDIPITVTFQDEFTFTVEFDWNGKHQSFSSGLGMPIHFGNAQLQIVQNPDFPEGVKGKIFTLIFPSDKYLFDQYAAKIYTKNLKFRPEKITAFYEISNEQQAIRHMQAISEKVLNYNLNPNLDSIRQKLEEVDQEIQRKQDNLYADSTYYGEKLDDNNQVIGNVYQKYNVLTGLKANYAALEKRRDLLLDLKSYPGVSEIFVKEFSVQENHRDEKELIDLVRQKQFQIRKVEEGNANFKAVDSLSQLLEAQIDRTLGMNTLRIKALEREIRLVEKQIAESASMLEATFKRQFAGTVDELRILIKWSEFQNLMQERLELLERKNIIETDISLLEEPHVVGEKSINRKMRWLFLLPMVLFCGLLSLIMMRPFIANRLKLADEIRFTSDLQMIGAHVPGGHNDLILSQILLRQKGKISGWLMNDSNGLTEVEVMARKLSDRGSKIKVMNLTAAPGNPEISQKPHSFANSGDLVQPHIAAKFAQNLTDFATQFDCVWIVFPPIENDPFAWQAIQYCDQFFAGYTPGVTTRNDIHTLETHLSEFASGKPAWNFLLHKS